MAYPYYQAPTVPGRSAAADELQRAFPGCRPLNTERSVLDLPIEIQPGRQTSLRITLPPMFPQERPGINVMAPVQNPAVDGTGSVRCRALEDWNCHVPGKANLVAAVQEALTLLTRPNPTPNQVPVRPSFPPIVSNGNGLPFLPGQTPSSLAGAGPGPGPPAPTVEAALEGLPTAELEKLLTDDEAFQRFMVTWVQGTQAAKTTEEIHRQNVALAQDNLAMQGSIDEARNHVAIVRSSEYASAKVLFDELYSRQEALLAKLSPQILLQKLQEAAEELDATSTASYDAFLDGSLPAERFVEQYKQQRYEFHKLDLMRQAGEFTSANSPLVAGAGWDSLQQQQQQQQRAR